ncbi:MAG: hypothetical protein COT81_00675 [Candidatus Buchananbacteria bacterium CG10_big_fil_rev_8_21_14_0_10_42_9]|uniref:Glycosyltransferase 2-like domain-containing protein n=1 Tax=Candidatus Buchananbacteria bacterium CG10_big_fil_rev_8_21_14_0_10_42_9 TaxID=1974526 RepID=A0A2H0W2E7_9BACT|nr:MAG: hypothetical protein COT81_00675 [Candidatus Buchananbacteria bacterium CG10_big_fil_rev_8_21_14_0_10_42_9]
MRVPIKTKVLEIIPGFLVWATFIAVFSMSLYRPLWAIYFIIIFDVYWVIRIIYLLIFMLTSWNRYVKNQQHNYWQRLQDFKDKDYRDYFHVVFLPTYKEPASVVEASIQSIVDCYYDKSKMMLVLAGEERDIERFSQISQDMRQKFEHQFHDFVITIHPKDLPGEIPGKGSNIHYAGHKVKRIIDDRKLDYSQVIVSSFDVDTRPHPQYFAALTYQYIKHPDPTHASFQPVAVYNNNIWESNPVVRVVASSTTFWLLTDLSRPERLFTFSSHSMSFKALADVGFWDKTIVTEDSRIFLQCFVHYQGNYKVEPVYIPLFMNTVEIGNWRKSIMNQYKQMRRWAWGAEHFPYMFKNFYGKNAPGRSIPFWKKFHYIWNQTEGVYSWATAPIIIFIGGYLPLWVASETIRTTTLFQNTPDTLSFLMRSALIGLLASSVIFAFLLPPKPKGYHWGNYVVMVFQWLMVPVTLILFGSVPAVDAQTRLMLGGKFRLGFWVSEKK